MRGRRQPGQPASTDTDAHVAAMWGELRSVAELLAIVVRGSDEQTQQRIRDHLDQAARKGHSA